MAEKVAVVKLEAGRYRTVGGRYQLTRERGRFRSQIYWRAIDLLPGATFGRVIAVANTLSGVRTVLSTKGDDRVPWATDEQSTWTGTH